LEAELRLKILNYLEQHNTLTLATTGNEQPWATALYYVNKDFVLYFLSKPQSRHCQNLTANPKVSAAVNEDYKDWTAIQGIQLEGRAYPVNGKIEKAKAMALYLNKYPFVKDFYSVSSLRRAMSSVKLYKIVPNIIWFIDNSEGYFNRKSITL